jgi:uncharacterized membrane protein YphA (DoxX/SURF4 family)
LVARLIAGGALLVAGLLKIGDLPQSVVAVRAYEFPVPAPLEAFLGYALPAGEIVLGLAIVAGLFTRWTALLGALAYLAYISAIISAWARGLNIDCGCFTPGGAILTPGVKAKYAQEIARDLGLLVCAVWLVVVPASRFSVDNWLRSPLDKEL